MLAAHEDQVLAGYIEDGRRPSRHANIEDQTWRAADRILPGARALAGTFPPGQRAELLRHGDGGHGRRRHRVGVDATRTV